MKIALTAAVAVTALGLAVGSASAQYPAVVPHRGHVHVVPAYGYAPAYSPGWSFGTSYASPGFGVGGLYSSGFGYGTGYYPRYGGYSPNFYSGGHSHYSHYSHGHGHHR